MTLTIGFRHGMCLRAVVPRGHLGRKGVDVVKAAAARATVVMAFVLIAVPAGAAQILDTGLVTFAGTSTQTGRLTRNGVASDWTSAKPFPGLQDALAHGYLEFSVNTGVYSFIEITLEASGTDFFASAYLNDFVPSAVPPNFGLNVNYLGDAGSSAALTSFQIQVAPGSTIAIPINEVNPGSGAGLQFRLRVDGFLNASREDVAAVPEPASLMLVGFGLSGVVARLRRKNAARQS